MRGEGGEAGAAWTPAEDPGLFLEGAREPWEDSEQGSILGEVERESLDSCI